MNDRLDLNIANVHISIHSTQIPILQEQDQAYLVFEGGNTKGNFHADIEVEVVLEEPPQTFGWKKIFEDEESLSAYRQKNEYLLCYTPAMHGVDPLWVAHFNQDFNHVVVYCSKKLVLHMGGRTGLFNPVRYPLDQFLMMYHLSKAQGVLVHAAGWELDGRAYLFPGKSGAGKSTLSYYLSSRENWRGLSDDRILVRISTQGIRCYGTPWPGEGKHALNSGAQLSSLFFLCHEKYNEIRRVASGEALKRLLPMISIPWYDRETCWHILKICEEILLQIPAYDLCFEPTFEVVDFLEDFIHSGEAAGLQQC
jgi:hypothetical protein